MADPSEHAHGKQEKKIHPDTLLKVDSLVEEYEMALRRRLNLQEEGSLEELERRKLSYRNRALANELRDLRRRKEDIQEEERELIGMNFWVSLAIIVVVVGLALIAGDQLEGGAEVISRFITHNLSWFYVLITTGMLLFLVYLALSRFGNVVLGDPGTRPEFSSISWYSMLFSAGMGVGILFFGAAEPMSHFLDPPIADPGSVLAARTAVAFSVFHWGLHAWAIYTICAAGVAYYGFRKRKKYLISSSILDVTSHAGTRKVVRTTTDMISTLAVVFGVSASLALGVIQLSSGFDHVFKTSTDNFWGYLIIISLLTAAFLISSSTGLDKGIKILSNVNMGAAVLLLLFVFFVGPTIFDLKLFVDTIGLYLQYLPELSFKVDPFRRSYEQYMGDWTLSYFTWWIAWSPFVGIFIARISRGRTLRELIFGCLLVPTLFGVFWFAVFGGTAIHLEFFEGANIGREMVEDPAMGVFLLFSKLPWPWITSVLTILLLFTFLVTSADSATFVISMITSEGDLDPPVRIKLIWGMTLAIVSLLLIVGGGMAAIQASTLIFAFPFAIVLVFMAISLFIRLSIQLKSERL